MISKFKKRHLRLLFCTSTLKTTPPANTQFKTQQSSNDYLSHLCKQNLHKEALRAFHSFQIQKPSFELYPSTYANLILACSNLKSLHDGRQVHRHLSESNTQPDVILQNHILNMYGKCGALAEARQLFEAMPEKNVVSWTSMIAGYTQNYREREAVELYLGMLGSGLFPDQFAFGNVVRACSGLADIELGKQLHCHAVKSDYGSDCIVQNALVSMYSKSNRIDEARVLFARITEKDLISWGSMIAGFAQQGYELEALHHFRKMLSLGFYHPNEFVFGSVFSACGGLLRLEYGEELHGLCLKFGFGTDAFSGCSLSDMYAKCGSLDYAKKVFYQIDKPDSVSWNSIISGFAYGGDPDEAMLLFSEMRGSGFKPEGLTVRCLLCAFTSSASLLQGQLVHSYILKMGLDTNVEVCNTLLTMYTKCSDISVALDIFEEMKSNRDLVSWNSILTACLQHNHPDGVFGLLKQMRDYGNMLDQITVNIILTACSELAYLEMGNQVHAYTSKVGLEADPMVGNSLIDTYAKCGSLDDARKLFNLMENKLDVVSWSSLIVGYAQFGCGKEALELFNDMRKLGIKPNHVTFVGVLSACSHVGLVDEGCYYYETMESKHGVVPTREHCTCIVDLLGRAGRLREAESFVNQMPYEPDVVVWKTLLAACRAQGNLEIGERAAEGVLKLDPSNSTAHVLLCNIYASSGYWHEVSRLRRLMKSNAVRKAPGKSWIKVKGEVCVFVVEDRSHPQMKEIYVMLGKLWLEMREAGYESWR